MRSDLTDLEFAAAYTELGPHQLSRQLGQAISAVYQRRRTVEKRIKRPIASPAHPAANPLFRPQSHPQRVCIDVKDGIVLVASDAHYWPGDPSIMHRAFLWACKEFVPKAVIMNGDVIDAATISRHPPIGWESRPSIQKEIENAQERLHEIELAVKRSTPLVWTLGNHDARFETRLATVAPEFAKLHGVHLRDHFETWEAAWSCWINDSVVVKHRFKGGIHATHNNAMWSGKTMITGHLHSAKVTPLTDYNGTRYGVDTGCLADTSHKAFVDYTEDGPLNWRSAFCVLTFKDGELLFPELVVKYDETRFQFRGELLKP